MQSPYLRILGQYLAGNHRAVSEAIQSSPHLSQAEKSLLRARLLTRKGQLNAAREVLDSAGCSTDFLSAEKKFLSANLLVNQGCYEEAICHFWDAGALYHAIPYEKGSFLCHYNSSVCYEKMGLALLGEKSLERAQAFQREEQERALVLRARAVRAYANGRHDECRDLIQKLLRLNASLPWIHQLENATVFGDLHVQLGESKIARIQLEIVARDPKHFNHLRAKFDLALLDIQETPRKFSGLFPEISENKELLLKWNVIHHLRSGHLQSLRRSWNALHAEFPRSYGGLLEVLDPLEKKSAFGRAIDLFQWKPAKDETQKAKPGVATTNSNERLAELTKILESAKSPVRKEELITLIWKVPYDPSLDARFYKLIERFKKSTSKRLLNINRAYFLVR